MKREYPDVPIPAVGMIIRNGDRILMIQRNQEPAKGFWAFPGGAIELGETILEAARREALEETGLEVEVGPVVAVVDSVVRDADDRVVYHYVIIDYFARAVGGTLQPGSDVRDARWVSLSDLDSLAMTEKAGSLARELLARQT